MKSKNFLIVTFTTLCISIIFFTSLSAQVNYAPPSGGWTYTYDGAGVLTDDNAALDGTWNHDNNSDSWAMDQIGDGNVPGGVNELTENGTDYIRIQECGDPRDFGYPDPSNRKICFLHFLDLDGLTNTENILDDGITLAFRARVATGDPLDELYENDALDIVPWLAEGDGYIVHDGGCGNFAVRQSSSGMIGFALAMKTDIAVWDNLLDVQGLVMNSLNGSAIEQDIMVHHGTPNILVLEDPTVWHEFWITIVSGGNNGTHVVQIWVDGAAESQNFEVTAGAASQAAGTTSYLQMGVANTSHQAGAFDVDYFSYTEGIHVPQVVGIETNGGEFPQDYALYNNYPNPFNPTTDITFAMKQIDKVNISVYNALGQLIETLFDGEKPAGMHTVTFNAVRHSSGVFFYRMAVGDKIFTKKMILMK